MAKVYGIQGNVVGKIANSVYAVVKGVNIVRAYNGSPANPQTTAQVASRAKLKLLSQLSAAVAPIIVFAADGMITPRNMFVKRNYGLVSYDESAEAANIDFASVDMSGGLVGMPPIALIERTQSAVTVSLQVSTASFDFVQWGGIIVDAGGRIVQIPPHRVDRQGDTPSAFEYTFANIPEGANGYIYGVAFRLNDDQSRTKYEQLTATATKGSVLVTRVLRELNVTASASRSVQFSAYEPNP